ncbi:hypothetical protein G6F37_009823 [Rhizopus arrhizus]|nr:hypothetical protein G6F38_009874 [Rhizopus arrhizus]KAG1154030.1 hypothetical protein G6F37_009823 [Rhizopus arrhizus]
MYYDLSLDSKSQINFAIVSNHHRCPSTLEIPSPYMTSWQTQRPNKHDVYLDRFQGLSSPLLCYGSTHPFQTSLQTVNATIEKLNTKLCPTICALLDSRTLLEKVSRIRKHWTLEPTFPTPKGPTIDSERYGNSLESTYWHRSFTFYSECIGPGLTFYGLGVLLKLFSYTRKIRHLTHVIIVPIGLITAFRKTVERCIQSTVQTEGSPLDSA